MNPDNVEVYEIGKPTCDDEDCTEEPTHGVRVEMGPIVGTITVANCCKQHALELMAFLLTPDGVEDA